MTSLLTYIQRDATMRSARSASLDLSFGDYLSRNSTRGRRSSGAVAGLCMSMPRIAASMRRASARLSSAAWHAAGSRSRPGPTEVEPPTPGDAPRLRAALAVPVPFPLPTEATSELMFMLNSSETSRPDFGESMCWHVAPAVPMPSPVPAKCGFVPSWCLMRTPQEEGGDEA